MCLDETYLYIKTVNFQNWISSGFDYTDQKADRAEWLVSLNCVIGGIIWFGFIMAYKPGIYR